MTPQSPDSAPLQMGVWPACMSLHMSCFVDVTNLLCLWQAMLITALAYSYVLYLKYASSPLNFTQLACHKTVPAMFS